MLVRQIALIYMTICTPVMIYAPFLILTYLYQKDMISYIVDKDYTERSRQISLNLINRNIHLGILIVQILVFFWPESVWEEKFQSLGKLGWILDSDGEYNYD
jgi:hypothetical protein